MQILLQDSCIGLYLAEPKKLAAECISLLLKKRKKGRNSPFPKRIFLVVDENVENVCSRIHPIPFIYSLC